MPAPDYSPRKPTDFSLPTMPRVACICSQAQSFLKAIVKHCSGNDDQLGTRPDGGIPAAYRVVCQARAAVQFGVDSLSAARNGGAATLLTLLLLWLLPLLLTFPPCSA